MKVPTAMRALVKAEAAPGLVLLRVPLPEPEPDEVLLRVRAASVCGTDLHIYKWDQWASSRVKTPRILGHEVCGDVVTVGSEVHTISPGAYVSADSHVTCGHCVYCRTGRGQLCTDASILGVDRNGTWAEYVTLPAINCWENPRDVPPSLAALEETLGNAVHTAFTVNLSAKKVLVTGVGPVGTMAVAVARAVGARAVYATDVSDYRLELAQQYGADLALNPMREDVVPAVMKVTEGEGVDVWLEMSGSTDAIAQGFQMLKPGGDVVVLGLLAAPMRFDLNNWITFKGVTVHGITGCRLWETWYQTRGLLRSGSVDLGPLVTHTFELEQYEDALEVMGSGESGAVVFELV